MDNHRSDASILDLSDRLSNDDQKHCHIDVGNDLSLSDSLVDQNKINEKNFTVSIKAFHEIDGNQAAKFSKGSKLKQIINSTEMLWIYLLLLVLLIIVGYYVLLCFSILNIIGIGQLKQQLKQVEDTFTKDNLFTNKSNFNGYSLVTTTVDYRVFTKSSIVKSNIHQNISWEQNGFPVAGNNGLGNQTNQFYNPFSLFIDDDDQTIYVADTENNRIMEWKFGATSGKMVAGTGNSGNETNQLNWPTSVIIDKEKTNLIICDMYNERIVQWSRQNAKNGQIIISNITCYALAMDNNGDLYVSDWKKHEVRRWKINENYGTLVAGGNGPGNHLDQLHLPTFVFVNEDHSVYVSDWYNGRVMKWLEGEKEGIVAAGGGQKDWNDPARLHCPWGLFVDHSDTIYVVDQDKNRIMRWYNGTAQGNIILGVDGKECGRKANQLCRPKGLSLDRRGNLYIADSYNCRIQRFNISQI